MGRVLEKIRKKLNQESENSGTTMVEVLAGFTILVFVVVECMVHIVGISGEMIMKSRDMQNQVSTLNQEMYKKDAAFLPVSGSKFTLTLDEEKTDTFANHAAQISISMPRATVYRFDCEAADLSAFWILHDE